jgi:hypothetical protein
VQNGVITIELLSNRKEAGGEAPYSSLPPLFQQQLSSQRMSSPLRLKRELI